MIIYLPYAAHKKTQNVKKFPFSLRLEPEARNIQPPKVALKSYPSGALLRIVHMKPDSTGRYIPDGIWTEWHEGGALMRFVDYSRGVPHGVEMTWGANGEVISRVFYQRGTRK